MAKHADQAYAIEQLELLQDISQANAQLAAGEHIPEEKAHTALLGDKRKKRRARHIIESTDL